MKTACAQTLFFGLVFFSAHAEELCADDGCQMEESDLAVALQTRGRREDTNGSFLPGPGPTRFLQFDGLARIPAEREVRNDLVRTVLMSLPLKHGGVQVRGKKAILPYVKMAQGEVYVDGNVRGQGDYGAIKTMFMKSNPVSMISDRVKMMFLEKTHTLKFSGGEIPTHTHDREKEKWRTQGPIVRAAAAVGRDLRLKSMNMFAALGLANQVIQNGKDFNHIEQLRDLVSKGGKLNKNAMNHWDAVQKGLKSMRRATGGVGETLRSSIACTHLEPIEGMTFKNDSVEIPLGEKIVVYRGRLASMPNAEYEMSTGVAYFEYNKKEDALEVVLLMSSMLEIYDSPSGFEVKFSLGPPEGDKNLPVLSEGRVETTEVFAGITALFGAGMLTPPDYNFMHGNREDYGCPDEVALRFAEGAKQWVKFCEIVVPILVEKGGHITDFITFELPTLIEGLFMLFEVTPCALEFMKTVDTGYAATWGPLEGMGFIHFLMEVPADETVFSLTDGKVWNTFEGQVRKLNSLIPPWVKSSSKGYVDGKHGNTKSGFCAYKEKWDCPHPIFDASADLEVSENYPTEEACCRHCLETEGCAAYSVATNTEGWFKDTRCWLKKKTNEADCHAANDRTQGWIF